MHSQLSILFDLPASATGQNEYFKYRSIKVNYQSTPETGTLPWRLTATQPKKPFVHLKQTPNLY